MTSPLVLDVRDRIRSAERPLTLPERAQLAATLMKPAVGGRDVVDELRAAVAGARSAAGPTLNSDEGAALRRLLAACSDFLDYTPEPSTPAAATAAEQGARGQAAHAAAGRHWADDRDDLGGRHPRAVAVERDAALAWANAR